MVDNRLDSRVLELNERYQRLKYSESELLDIKIKRYLASIKRFDFKQILSDLRYRRYAKKNFSCAGNTSSECSLMNDISNARIAVYSCIVGRYDSILEPVIAEDNVDYYMFTDLTLQSGSAWTKIDLTEHDDYYALSPNQLNRKIKILQTEILRQYDYTVYVDGNIEIVCCVSPMIESMGGCSLGIHYHRSRDCIYDEVVAVKHLKRLTGLDMEKQISGYREKGFPAHFGLYENSIIIRNNNDSATLQLMADWWDEYVKHPTRDQLSLPYVIWDTEFSKDKIHILGNDIQRNPRFNRFYGHEA